MDAQAQMLVQTTTRLRARETRLVPSRPGPDVTIPSQALDAPTGMPRRQRRRQSFRLERREARSGVVGGHVQRTSECHVLLTSSGAKHSGRPSPSYCEAFHLQNLRCNADTCAYGPRIRRGSPFMMPDLLRPAEKDLRCTALSTPRLLLAPPQLFQEQAIQLPLEAKPLQLLLEVSSPGEPCPCADEASPTWVAAGFLLLQLLHRPEQRVSPCCHGFQHQQSEEALPSLMPQMNESGLLLPVPKGDA
eukprot:scaffold1311_cov256-Pinguiococcus_pyrenoidosus.AAC.17